jgi:beta-lactam-binding protein with PASTA domain
LFGFYLWGNLLAMVLVIALLGFGVKYGLEIYTHHGEGIKVPQLEGMTMDNARLLVAETGLEIMVTDSGYNKRLPANCVLAQSPGAGMEVKAGHVIYVTVNSPSSPTFAIPDVIDNSSYREAEAKLMALGFKLLPPKRVLGEKDWVYGIISRGRPLNTGDHVSIDVPLTLIIGNGRYGEDEDIDYVDDYMYPEEHPDDDVDEFQEVDAPSRPSAAEQLGKPDNAYDE